MEIEKTRLKHDRRDNRVAAEIAVRQRKVAKSKFRQNLNKDLIGDHKFVEQELFKIQYEIGGDCGFRFTLRSTYNLEHLKNCILNNM